MSQQLASKIINAAGLPKNAKAFIGEFDGNEANLSGLFNTLNEIGDADPDAKAFVDSIMRNAGSGEDMVGALADALYPQAKGGIKGKDPNATTQTESRVPENDPGKDSLPDVPAEKNPGGRKPSISPAARKHAADLGVDLSTVTGSGKNGAITKGDIEKAARAAEGTGATQTSEAAPKPAVAAADDDLSDLPIPGLLGATQADLDVNDDPVPGLMGLTRRDALKYIEPNGTLVPPVKNPDASSPAPAPAQQRMSVDDEIAALDALGYTPPPVDLSNLSDQLGTVRDSNAGFRVRIRPQQAVPTQVSTYDPSKPVGKIEPAPGRPIEKSAMRQFFDAPATSMADKFLNRVGAGAGAFGMNYVTKPLDAIVRYGAPLLAGYGAYKGIQAATRNPGASQEEMDELDRKIEETGRAAEQVWGQFRPQREQMPPRRNSREM